MEKGKVQRKVQRKVQCRFIDVQHRRGLAGCGRARATTESHDAGEGEKRKQPCGDSESEGSETGSDGEWSGDDDPLSDHGREDEDEKANSSVNSASVKG